MSEEEYHEAQRRLWQMLEAGEDGPEVDALIDQVSEHESKLKEMEETSKSELVDALYTYDDCLSEKERQKVRNIRQRLRSGAHVDDVTVFWLSQVWADIQTLRDGPDGPGWDSGL